jgi:hypothetical protein
MTQLTDAGKKSVRILIFLILVTIALMVMFVLSRWYIPYPYLVVAVIPFSYYGARYSNLNYALEQQALATAGFYKDSEKSLNFSSYNIAKRGKGDVLLNYQGQLHGSPFRLINFSITVGSGKNKYVHQFTGAEFETTKENLPVQIYDNSHPLKPWFGKRKLEANEFHERFTVYAGEDKHAFYQLDPDTMHDLIVLRGELGAPVNVEFLGRKVLIYTTKETYTKAFKKRLSFTEVMNGAADQSSLNQYANALNNILEVCWKIFQTLDLAQQKTDR